MSRRRLPLLVLSALAGALFLYAQSASFTEGFDGSALGTLPAGWADSPVGSPSSRSHGFFQVAADPANPANRVLATTGDAGVERGTPIVRTGFMAHRIAPRFDLTSPLTVTARLLRALPDGAVGVTFLSGYPASDAYYVLGVYASSAGAPAHVWIAGAGGAMSGGAKDLGPALPPGTWMRLRVRCEAVEGGTRIAARFWADGSSEPAADAVDFVDSGASRPAAGTVGVWGSRRGFKGLDDLAVDGSIAPNVGPPTPTPTPGPSSLTVALTESGSALQDGSLFNRAVQPDWTIAGGTPPYAVSAALDGRPFSQGGTVNLEGAHRLTVSASDSGGRSGSASAGFAIDTTPPLIAVLDGRREISDGALFNRHWNPIIAVSDEHLSSATTRLNGAPFVSGSLIPTDGSFTLDIEASDAAGNVAHRMLHFTVDTVPPKLSNIAPADGAFLTSSPGPVTGDCDDAVSVTVNSVPAAVAGGHFRLDAFPFPEGPVSLTIVARDRAGNSSTARESVTTDSQPPAVTIDSPVAGAYLKDPTATVTGVATDATLVSVSVNGVPAALGALGAFSAVGVPLPEGPVTLTATATDRAGRTASQSVAVVADRTPPKIIVTQAGVPLVDGATFRNHLRVHYAATDASPVTVHAMLNGVSYPSDSSIDNDGSYELDVEATDAAGNRSIFGAGFGIDTAPPRLTILAPPAGTVTNASTITVSGDCDDAVSVTVAGVTAAVSGGHFVASNVPLPAEGTNSLAIAAQDAAGNPASAALPIVRDTIAPVVTITAPAPNSLTGASTATVTGTADDLHLTSVDVNGGAATLTGTSFRRDVPLVEGPNVLVATALDAAGNSGQARETVTRDATAPAVTIASPADGSVIAGASVDVSGDALDAHLDHVTVNGVAAVLSGTHFTAAAVPLSAGPNTLTARATDAVGNSASASVHVTRDDSAIPIAIDTPPAGSRLRDQPISVSGSVGPAVSPSVTVNGIAAPVSAGRFTAASVPLNEGVNTLTARVTEPSTGRSGVSSAVVLLDTTAPRVVSVTPADGASNVAAGVVVRVSFSEAVDPATVSAGSVALAPDAGGPAVAASLAVSGSDVSLSPAAALAGQTAYRLTVTTAVADLAGNPLTAPFTSRFTTAAGGAGPNPPVLDPVPAALCAASLAVTGSADPGLRVRAAGGASVVTATVASDGRFSISVPLLPDQVNALQFVTLDASDRASAPVSASVRADCTPPTVESADLDGPNLRIVFSEAMDPATLTIGGSVTLTSASGELGSSITFDSTGTEASVVGIRDLSPETFTLTVSRAAGDLVGNRLAAPFVQTFLPGGTIGLLGKTFDDRIGRPLPGVAVTVVLLNGSAPPPPAPTATSDGEGRFALVVPAGEAVLVASRDGYVPVTRIEVAQAGEATTAFDVRLTPEASVPAAADGSAGLTDLDLTLAVPPGTTAPGNPVRGADVLPQGLPALAPLGWTPAAGLSLEFGQAGSAVVSIERRRAAPLASAADAVWKNRLAIPPGTPLVLALYDGASRRYLAQGSAQVSPDGARIEASIPSAGVWVAFAADPDPFAPDLPAPGEPLAGVPAPPADPILSAAVSTDPGAVLPTQTADVTATLALSSPLPSGYPVQALVTESLTLLDGRTIQVPSFLADLSVVRDGAGRSIVPFRVRPSDTAAQVALSVGYGTLQMKHYPFEVRRGDLLSPGGGSVTGTGGFSISVDPGALTDTVPVTLSPISDPANLPVPIPSGFTFLAALQLTLGGASLSAPATLRWASAGDPTGGGLVFVEVAQIAGIARLQFVAPGRYDAANAVVETVPPQVHQLPVPGVSHGGLFLLLAADPAQPLAYAKGHVLDVGGAALSGAVVSEDANPLVAVADNGGSYGLAIPAAGTTVRSQRPDTGNEGSAPVPPQPPGVTATVDIPLAVTAPYVVSVVPDTVPFLPLGVPVVFNLSEPLDAATVSDASVTAVGPAGAIAGSVRLSANGSQVTFTPAFPWPGKSRVTLTLLSTVTDRNGYRLVDRVTKAVADFVAVYDTIDPTPPSDVNPLLILMGVPQGSPSTTTITGAPGAACGGCTVTAINETTQATATTQAAGDGSFTLQLLAGPSDVVTISIKRPGGGGEITLNPGPFRSDGGRTAIVGSRAADYVTPDHIRVTLPDGTFGEPVTLRVTPIAQAALPAPVPTLSSFMGAVAFDPGDAVARKPIDVGVAAPPGVTGGTFLVARAVIVLGEQRWMVVDTARYDNGEITTRPAPSAGSAVATPLKGMILSSAGPGLLAAPIPDSAKDLLDRITRRSNLVFLQLTMDFAFLEGTIQHPNATVSFTFSSQYAFLAGFVPFVWVARESRQQSYFLVPIPANADYTFVVRDGTTGFTLFQGNFSGLTDPSNITNLPPGATPSDLPAPRLSSGSPFTALTFVPVPAAAGDRRLLLPSIEYEFPVDPSGQGNLSLYGSAGALPASVKATLQNNVGGSSASVVTAADGSFGPLTISARQAEDVTFVGGTRSLAITGSLGVSFTEPFPTDDASLSAFKSAAPLTDADAVPAGIPLDYDLVPEAAGPDGSRSFTIVPFTAFQRGHRILLHLPGGSGAPAAVNTKPLPAPVDIEMFTPKDDAIGVRSVNDVNALYLRGGLLLEATADQLLNLYDASDPGNVRPCGSKPLASVPRGITMDDAGRILVAMGGGSDMGRLQVFLLGPPTGSGDCGGRTLIDEEQLSSSFTQLTLPVGDDSGVLPQGFPKAVRVFTQNTSEKVVVDRDTPTLVTFQKTDVSPSDGKQDRAAPLKVTGVIASGGAPSPLNQPATVFNRTTGESFSVFADASGAFSVDARASSGDLLEIVENNAEVALVGTLGFGIQGVEVNRTMHLLGQSCDPASGGAESLCPAATRRLFSFGGAPDQFGGTPDVQLCRLSSGGSCVDLVTDLERLNDLELLPASSGAAVSPSGQPLVVAAVARFGLGLFTISGSGGSFHLQQAGPGLPLNDRGTPPVFPQLFAVTAARDFPVKPGRERKFCTSSKWAGYKPTLAFAAAGSMGVIVADITDASAPQPLGIFKVSDSSAQANTLALDAQRGLLYVGMGGEGVVVYDMTDPCTLTLPGAIAPPTDPRALSRVPVANTNVNVPFALDPDTGVLFGAGDPADGAPAGSGKAFALSPLDPPLRFVADTDRDGVWEKVSQGCPLGVPNPGKATAPYCPDVVRVLASIWGSAGKEITVAVSATSVAGFPLAEIHTGFPRSQTHVILRRQSDDPANPGYNRYLSPPIVLVADPRARSGYSRLAGEADPSNPNACRNCQSDVKYTTELAELFTAPPLSNDGRDRDHPIKQAFEQWTGEKLVVQLAEDEVAEVELKDNASYLAAADLQLVRAEARTARGDLTPALLQPPPQNASLLTTEAGVVVATNSGEAQTAWTDLSIKGRGLDFVLTRNYVSDVLHVGPFGRNMDSSLFARLRDNPGGDVDFYPGDGSRWTFRFDAAKRVFVPPTGLFLALYRLPDRTFLLVYPDNTRLFFDEQGRLTKLADRKTTTAAGTDGNQLKFLYDGGGRLAVVLDATNRPVSFDYYDDSAPSGSAGLIASVTDFDDRTVTYAYDADGRLTDVDGPDPQSLSSKKPHTTLSWTAAVGDLRQTLYRGGEIHAIKDGEDREVIEVGYQPAQPGSAEALTLGGGTWTLSYAGPTTLVTDPNGNTRGYNHEPAGQAKEVTEPDGSSTKYDHDAEGRQTALTRPMGGKVSYAYAPADGDSKLPMGNVLSIVESPRPGSPEAQAGQTRTTSIEYGVANLPTRLTAPDGGVTSITRDGVGNPVHVADPSGRTSDWVFNGRGQVMQVTDSQGSSTTYEYFEDANGLKSGYEKRRVENGAATTYEPDNRGNVTGLTDAAGRHLTYPVNGLDYVEGETSPTGQKKYEYDAAGNMTRSSAQSGVDVNSQPTFSTTSFTYDSLRAMTGLVAPEGTTTYAYDSNHRLQSVDQPDGKTVSYAYDSRSRTASRTAGGKTEGYGYDSDNNRTSVTSPKGKTTAYLFDGFSRMNGSTDPSGLTTISRLDSLGRPVEAKVIGPGNRLFRWTQTSFDAMDRVLDETKKVFASPIVLNADGTVPNGITIQDAITRWTYDGSGNVLTVRDPLGRVATNEYDGGNRLLKTVDPAGNTIEYSYDGAGNRASVKETDVRTDDGSTASFTTSTDYDHENRPKTITDPLGRTRTYTYDNRGYLLTETETAGNTTSHQYDQAGRQIEIDRPEGIVTKFEYDGNGNVTKVLDANDKATSYSYDTRNRLTSITYPDGKSMNYGYDDDGNVVSQGESGGSTVAFTVDDNGRPTSRSFTPGPGIEGPTLETFVYDPLGRLLSADNGKSRVDMSYDSLDRVTMESLTVGGIHYQVSSVRDLAGNTTNLTYPSGRSVAMTPDPLDRVATVTEAGQPIASYAYVGRDRLAKKSLQNGISQTFTYDGVRRPTAITAGPNAGAPVVDHRYGWTSADRKAFATLTNGKSDLYGYDQALRLISERLGVPGDPLSPSGPPDVTKTFGYDTVNGLASINDSRVGPMSATNDPAHRLLTLGGLTVTWDAMGNLSTKSGSDHIVYDAAHRPVRIEHSDGSKDEFQYDALGRRFERATTIGVTTTRTLEVSCADHVLAEFVNGQLDREYVWGNDADELVQIKRDSDGDGILDETLYPILDELNSVHALTDSTGQAVERYRYESDGKTVVQAPDISSRNLSTFGNTITWQGRPWIGDYGYFRNRWLDPESHTWLTPDPAHYPEGVSNAYSLFGRNGGTSATDPWGLWYLASAREDFRYFTWRSECDLTKGDGCVYASLDKRDATTIFIHGYAVDSYRAAVWASTMETRLWAGGYRGSLIAFTWPGNVGPLGIIRDVPAVLPFLSKPMFVQDILEARQSGGALAYLIRAVRRNTKPSLKLSLLSHSLGAEVLLNGLQLLAETQQRLVDVAIMTQAAVPSAYLRADANPYRRYEVVGKGEHELLRESELYRDWGRYADAPKAVALDDGVPALYSLFSNADEVLAEFYPLAGHAPALGLQFSDALERLLPGHQVDTTPGRFDSWCSECGIGSHSAYGETSVFAKAGWPSRTHRVFQLLARYLNK